jgi:quercetin dioxygenase-like cupin family protein
MSAERRQHSIAHLGQGEGRSLWVLGELVTYKVTGEQTGGAYSLFEVATQPGDGSPPHVQHWEDEAIYVLVGEYELLVEGDTMTATPGSLVYVPRGRLHAYTNVGNEPGRVLTVHTPGDLHENFFEEIGEDPEPSGSQVPGSSFDLGSVAETVAKYGIEIPLPEGNRDERDKE